MVGSIPTSSLQSAAHKKFRIATVVNFRRIKEIDARGDRSIKQRMRAFLINATAEGIASESH